MSPLLDSMPGLHQEVEISEGKVLLGSPLLAPERLLSREICWPGKIFISLLRQFFLSVTHLQMVTLTEMC